MHALAASASPCLRAALLRGSHVWPCMRGPSPEALRASPHLLERQVSAARSAFAMRVA